MNIIKTLRYLLSKVYNPSYKVYTALLTQEGTNDPVAIVLENTIGNIVWERFSAGKYDANLINAFPLNKTVCFISVANDGNNVIPSLFRNGGNTSLLASFLDATDGTTYVDLDNNEDIPVSIEIRVYN